MTNLMRMCVLLSSLLCSAVLAVETPTLEQITAEPDWIARSPENPRWLIDGSGIRYSQRREGLVGRDFSDDFVLFMNDLDGEPMQIQPDGPGPFMLQSGDWHRMGRLRLFTHSGDLFIFNRTDGTSKQLTKTVENESRPMFLSDNSGYAFQRGGNWIIRSTEVGIEMQAADIRFADRPKDPDEEKEEDRDYLEEQQRRLFKFIELDDEREELREQERSLWRDTDPTDVVGPFYLGKDNRSLGSYLSPSGRHMLVAMTDKKQDKSRRDSMPDYINADGYVSSRGIRAKVGHQRETPVRLVLLDLREESQTEISIDHLSTITENPLAWLLEKNDEEDSSEKDDSEKKNEKDEKDPKARPVSLMGVRWNDAGNKVAVMLASHDNKDRWIGIVDTDADEIKLDEAHHLRDDAWIGWDFHSFGWAPFSDTMWYISEESGYAHLYFWKDGQSIQRTSGEFEVRDVRFSNSGARIYMRTNRAHPGIQELEVLTQNDQNPNPVTDLRGTVESYRISPDERFAVITWSNINSPPELYLIDLTRQQAPKQLTNTVSDAFRAMEFQTPEIVAVPSSHTEQPIYMRLYRPDTEKFKGPRPIVVFSHGAGYLQHANYEWSYYKREHMFHTILTNEGFIVIAPDFRASAGYGRDWRTAIYRQMGYPELEDFKDCIDWTVENEHGDANRVGIYGGSYGGFMTLMAMFLEPETYKCGAALRSVTDWAHYNHGYTSNILNTPEIDPEAFEKSSPIEHAEGLQGRLLMLHGMLDDNVVAQDIIRLSQRLIELEKENWELALHPIEPHGYKEPSSWLDQMRRIHKLFIEELADDAHSD